MILLCILTNECVFTLYKNTTQKGNMHKNIYQKGAIRLKKNPFVNFVLAGVSITDFGLLIPSPFASLELSNSEISSMTSWTLKCTVGGDQAKRVNVAAFEALLYSAAQSATYANASGIPVSFIFGWIGDNGAVESYLSYQGFTLKYSVSTNGLYMNYTVTGYASLSVQNSMPVLNIPAVCGIVQPSAVLEAVLLATKADTYYDLDIDHNDQPTLVNHGAMTTSLMKYTRGEISVRDNYDDFHGLLALSKAFSISRDASGIDPRYKSLSQIMNNTTVSPVSSYMTTSYGDTAPQCASFSFWIDEPTMTKRGVIHYKSDSSLLTTQSPDVLKYGTTDSNVLSIQGSYDGVAYSMTNMNFSQVGFAVDCSGNALANEYRVVNSWSSSLASVFQTANIINDINALATQFSGDFKIQIPGSVKSYSVAQPVSLVVYSGGTLSPITGVYNIISVSHSVSTQFITTLSLQRLMLSSANQTAAGQGILINGNSIYGPSTFKTTKNIVSPYKVDFGELYPNFEHISSGMGVAV